MSPLEGVLPKTRDMTDRNISTLNQLLEPINSDMSVIGSLTNNLLKIAMGDIMCEEQNQNKNITTHDQPAPMANQQTTEQAASSQSGATPVTSAAAPPNPDAHVTGDTGVLTLAALRQELDRQHNKTLAAVGQHTAGLLHSQLEPRDKLTCSMISKINIHGAALMELSGMMAELNSNKGGTHLKNRVDHIERQLTDYSFLLEGLARNDKLPLELLVLGVINGVLGANLEARDIDLAVRFGDPNRKPRTVLVTMV